MGGWILSRRIGWLGEGPSPLPQAGKGAQQVSVDSKGGFKRYRVGLVKSGIHPYETQFSLRHVSNDLDSLKLMSSPWRWIVAPAAEQTLVYMTQGITGMNAFWLRSQ